MGISVFHPSWSQRPYGGPRRVAGHPLADRQRAYFPLNESGGTVIRNLVTGLDGQFVNAPAWTASRFGPALDFNGTNDRIDVPDGPEWDNVPQMTWSLWIKPDSVATQMCFLMKGTYATSWSYALQTNSTNLRVFVASILTDPGNNLVDTNDGPLTTAGAWYHVAVVFDGNQSTNTTRIRMFVNGVERSEASGGGTIPAALLDSANAFRIGDFVGLGRPFDGSIADVAVYHAALTPTQIRHLYQEPWGALQPPAPALLRGFTTISSAPQTDTWTQPVVGTAALKQGARVFLSRVQTMQALLRQAPQDVDGPLVTQPDTWTQPVPGTSALRSQRFNARLASAPTTSWNFDHPFTLPPEPEIYLQPVAGTDALARQGRAWLARVRAINPLLWTTAQDLSDVLPTQPDLYLQSVQGTRALRLAQQRAFFVAAGVAPLGWFTPFDQPFVESTWTQPIVGTAALRQTATAFTRRAGLLSRLLWFTPEDLSAALGLQPDTYVQPIPGMTALTAAALRYNRRARLAQRGFYVTHDDPAFTAAPFGFGHRSGPIERGSGHGRSGPIVHVTPKRTM